MARFTDIENQLLQTIHDCRLKTNLTNIRESVEDIWSADTPRIIRGYTHHGIEHSERLAGFAQKLLQAKRGRGLSEEEMYLLLASIYLHDIGMQCDVVKFPQIRETAEKLGAHFEVEFTTQIATEYTIEEQKAIRQNHQYLTAAWIEYARSSGNTVLGAAAKAINLKLVEDLMDVCKHHAKIPISKCPLTFSHDPNGRKQLVATLVRFSDELDVDVHRVSLETVKNFSLDPANSVYWWLHSHTDISFAHNSITLTIILHPDDAKQYGPLVHKTFIDGFKDKNRDLLTILRQHDIPLVISADSKVGEDRHAEKLTDDIAYILNEIIDVEAKEDEDQKRRVEEKKREGKEETMSGICPKCRNLISFSNKSLICKKCSAQFCDICEGWFRGGERKRGEGPICKDCFTAEKEEQLRKEEEEEEEHEKLVKEGNSIGMKFVLITVGEFDMGSPSGGKGSWNHEGAVHRVKIENAFYIGMHEVTQKQWREVMGNNPSRFKGDDLPVERVSWDDVQEFVRKLNEKEGTDKYRLPSEAEWEYAARARSTTLYSFGDGESRLGEYAWYSGNSGDKTHTVGQKMPNPWGLYDMHGNVWEWVQDKYHSDYDGAPTDGSAWEGSGSHRVFRGGSWHNLADYCRSAFRGNFSPGGRDNDLGFRLLRKT